MRLLHSAALAALLGGCFTPTETAVAPADGGQIVEPVEGSLTVHLPWPSSDAYAFLGDGSRFVQKLSEGRAEFRDPSLTGPQTVSVVSTRYVEVDGGTAPEVSVATYVDVDRAHVYLRPTIPGLAPSKEESPTVALKGTLTNLVDDPHSFGWLTWSDGEGFATETIRVTPELAAGGWSYELSVPEDAGAGTVVAWQLSERDFSALRAGIVRDIALAPAGVTEVDIVLDQEPTDSITVAVEGAEAPSASIRFSSINNLRTRASGTSPLTVPAFPDTGAFAGRDRIVCAEKGDAWHQAAIARALGSENSVSMTLPRVPEIRSPDLATGGEFPRVAKEDLVISWDVDPSAQAVVLVVASHQQAGFRWEVQLPASRQQFEPFELPETVAPVRFLPDGDYQVHVASVWSERVSDYQERFGETSTPQGVCGLHLGGRASTASTSGSLRLE